MIQKLTLPEIGIKYSKDIRKRMLKKVLSLAAEDLAREIYEDREGQKFNLAANGKAGYDIISEDGKIRVEVKSCHSLHGRQLLRVGNIYTKFEKCDEVVIVDFFNDLNNPLVALIPHDTFYDSHITAGSGGGLWSWDADYFQGEYVGKMRAEVNTKVFLEHLTPYSKQILNRNFSETKLPKDLVV